MLTFHLPVEQPGEGAAGAGGDAPLDMPAVLGIQFFVHFVLLGHEQVQEPVFLRW